MIAVDSSVLIAAFASWHQGHERSAAALARRPRVPAHVVVETYSVLTRLPVPHRAPASLVAAFLGAVVEEPPLVLPAKDHLRLIDEASAAGIEGGSVYDALIGACVRHAGGRLLTRDRRAASTYERLGVAYELVA